MLSITPSPTHSCEYSPSAFLCRDLGRGTQSQVAQSQSLELTSKQEASRHNQDQNHSGSRTSLAQVLTLKKMVQSDGWGQCL